MRIDLIHISGSVKLKKGKEGSVKRFHPWIFSGAIQSITGAPADGSWVSVADSADRVLGYGHIQKGTISVRMITFAADAPSLTLWRDKIRAAFRQRLAARVPSRATNAFRLIHGEGDGLPGLIVDLYNKVAVMQTHSEGMYADRQAIALALKEELADDVTTVYCKSLAGTGTKQGEYLLGAATRPHLIAEHDHAFYVDWEEGQKTGFFLDQRENRKLLGELAPGRSVLNTFCYTGGFSVYALSSGAQLVHSVDASEKAVDGARRNIELNGFDSLKHACFTADTFDFFKEIKEKYDLIILDPPAFAKHRDARHQAMRGYQRLNAEAMRLIAPGGILFTFSCSQVVDRQLFQDTVVSSAIQSGREIKILHRLSQPADHPVSVYHPEGEYLKGLVLYVS